MIEITDYQVLANLVTEYITKKELNIKNTQYLDIGCGHGIGAKQFGEHFSLETWGISREKIIHKIEHPLEGDVMDILPTLSKNHFTIITSVDFLDYIVADFSPGRGSQVMDYIVDILKPGGILAVNEMKDNMNSIMNLINKAKSLKTVRLKLHRGEGTCKFSRICVKIGKILAGA